ncbi:MAG: cation:proton antiporter [Planctomycetes bacterium]|nr:cation:proton antiporter [Planctomycetota bacterium]
MADLVVPLATFGVIALASRKFGAGFARVRLPLITGFLAAGIITGPYALEMISVPAVGRLKFLDSIALGFIAFAAGSELLIAELRSRLKSIQWVTIGLVTFTFILTAFTIVLIGDWIPFAADKSFSFRLGVALLAGSILVARSPSSAIAVVNELRAHGPFTRTALGVTVVMDVVVILIFALNSSLADALFSGESFAFGLILLVLGEIVLSLGLGLLLGRLLLPALLRARIPEVLRTGLLLGLGYGVFFSSALVHERFHLLFEPLLVCMFAAFVLTNFTPDRAQLQKTIDSASPLVYTVFFTYAGASLQLDVLTDTWLIALILFAVRIAGIFLGSFFGGVIAKDPMRFNRVGWMSYVTQAGIGLGLAKEVANEFPLLGTEFTTLIVSIIVLNQIVGPLTFKWVLQHVGEAHVQHGKRDLKGTPLVLIFGLDGQSLALARQLDRHGWRVRIVSRTAEDRSEVPDTGAEILPIAEFTREALAEVGAEEANAIVSLIDDEASYRVCEIAFEYFGTRTLIAQLHDRENEERFRAINVRIVNPETALVGLLDHFVRSPRATSMMIGLDPSKDIEEFEVRNPELNGVALRDLRLPLDTLVLSVERDGASLVSHGYTTLNFGDRVTVLGEPKSLLEVQLKLSD